MISLSEDPKYGFAVGRVRALETALMDKPRYDRFVRARGGEEFVAALAESAYGRLLENGVAGVTQALDRAADENAKFLSEYALDEWLQRLFLIPTAIRDLKTAIKSALLQGRTDVTIPKDSSTDSHNAIIVKVVAETVEAFYQNRNPAAVDVAMDRLLQQIELQTATASGFMTGYLGLHADVENLRTLVRLKAKDEAGRSPAGEMAAAFIPGGTLTPAAMAAALPQPWPAVLDLLAKAPPYGAGSEFFQEYLEQGRAAVGERRSFIRMERFGREAELRYLRQTRYATFGHEPLVAFFLLHENELRNLRLLYAAKLAGIAAEQAQDLVAYVE